MIKISTMLKEHNINTFVAKYDIKSGEKWSNKIKDSLRESQVFLSIITKEYHNSSYTDQEVGMALAMNIHIIPIRLDDSIPKGFLNEIHAEKFSINVSANCDDLVTEIKEEYKLANSKIKEIPNIKLKDRLSTKYAFNDTSSDKFGMHTDLQNIDVIQVNSTYSMVDPGNKEWHNSLKPRIYFIMQPEKNLESISNNCKIIFDKLVNREMIEIQNNSILLNKINNKIPDIEFTRHDSKFPYKTDYIQHYYNGALLYAFTYPLLEITNKKLYLMLNNTTMMLLSFILSCREYFKEIKYKGNITFEIAIKSSKDMILSHLKSNGRIVSTMMRPWMRDTPHNCDHDNIYLKMNSNSVKLSDNEILKIVKYFTDTILRAYKYDTESSMFDQKGKLSENDIKIYNNLINENNKARV